MVFPKIESRILVGTLAFLGIMALTGWIAINEGGRMRDFETQFLARSIERGAGLFATNCTSCHGLDGRGLTGIAPALNNPHLMGYNYFASIDSEVELLNAERAQTDTTADRVAEIDTRLAELATQREALVAQMGPAIEKGYDVEHPTRLGQLGWAGSRYAFLYTTLVHGRPTSSSYWPQPMAAWSQTAGGPLRDDQLQDLVNYIENWDKGNNFTLEDLIAVNQFARVPVQDTGNSGFAEGEGPVGQDVAAILTELEGVTGDPVNGQALYTAQACAGCHEAGVVAPMTAGTWTRIENERLQDPALAGYTALQYAVESIVDPHAYLAPGYGPVMPANFGDVLSLQQLADLVAFLESQDS
jgi:mono/diheme cytochrome c family protein